MSTIDLLRAKDGTLTQDLVLQPAKFGLGHVPAKLTPDATTSMVCGFCSTGCSLNIHLQGGEAINLTPTPDYPVNLGMACPKGWEALSVLKSADRGTTPLMRTSPNPSLPRRGIHFAAVLVISSSPVSNSSVNRPV